MKPIDVDYLNSFVRFVNDRHPVRDVRNDASYNNTTQKHILDKNEIKSTKNTSSSEKRDIIKLAYNDTHDKYSYDEEFKTWVLKILNNHDEVVSQIPAEISLKIQRMVDNYISGSIINLKV